MAVTNRNSKHINLSKNQKNLLKNEIPSNTNDNLLSKVQKMIRLISHLYGLVGFGTYSIRFR